MSTWHSHELDGAPEDPAIRASLSQTGFRVMLSLVGAAPGLYLWLTGGPTTAYIGPLLGVAGWVAMLGPIWRIARAYRATHWEMVRREKSEQDD